MYVCVYKRRALIIKQKKLERGKKIFFIVVEFSRGRGQQTFQVNSLTTRYFESLYPFLEFQP